MKTCLSSLADGFPASDSPVDDVTEKNLYPVFSSDSVSKENLYINS